MKKQFIPVAFIMTLSIVLAGCSTSNTNVKEATVVEEPVKDEPIVIPDFAITKTFNIADMTCASCAVGIQASILEIDGVYASSVDYATATGDVTYDPGLVTDQQIIDAALPYLLTF